MEIFSADHDRLLQLAGVLDPVRRPVDIDRSTTGFAVLRSLRIYCFAAGSVIDGHAEDDELLIIVLTGSIELALTERELEDDSPGFALSGVANQQGTPCAAYLPPGGAYRLTPRSDAEVAYARATPSTGRAPAVFSGKARSDEAGDVVLLEEATYPQLLRLRVVQLAAGRHQHALLPLAASESSCEALIHVRTEPIHGAAAVAIAGGKLIALTSWDTVAVRPGEQPSLLLEHASSALLLIVLATRAASACQGDIHSVA